MKSIIIFMAMLGTAVTAVADDESTKRAEALRANVKKFRLNLNYHGTQEKPFYRLALSVELVVPKQASQFDRHVQITEETALCIINELEKKGFFQRAVKTRDVPRKIPDTCYRMRFTGGEVDLTEVLDLWELSTYQRFDELRNILKGEAAKSMDFLVGRVSGIRGFVELKAEAKQAKISLHEWPGYGRQGHLTYVRFVVHPNGKFRFNQTKGTLPQEEIDKLLKQIKEADVGPGVEDAPSITFRWLDDAGKRQEKVFTNPETLDRQKLLAKVRQLAKEYKAGKAVSIENLE